MIIFLGVFIYSPVNMTITTAIPRVYIAILRDRDTFMHTSLLMCVCVCIHTYIYTYIYTYIHIYILSSRIHLLEK